MTKNDLIKSINEIFESDDTLSNIQNNVLDLINKTYQETEESKQ